MSDQDVIEVGSEAPDFALPSVAGPAVRLSDFRGKHNVIMYFMREFR